jgi:hypothetical protein
MIEIVLLAGVCAAGTWLGGWWTVAVVAVVWSLWRRRGAWRAGVAAALGWTALLSLTIPWAPLGRLAVRLGGMFGLPGWAALLLPPLFAFLLGWSGARAAYALRMAKVTSAPPGSRTLNSSIP